MTDYARNIEEMIRCQLRDRGITDPAVLHAMATVPRHRFVGAQLADQAYSDRALPTTDGQTISQPYMVARMTELLQVEPGMSVLEIGTGSGYQTAILAVLGARVVSVERWPSLAQRAETILQQLNLAQNVQIVLGDGTLGWDPAAPYQRILVTAAAPRLPEAYRRQLADPGRIVIPIGSLEIQDLTIWDRTGERWTCFKDTPCKFVPLLGKDGWPAPDPAPRLAPQPNHGR